MAKRAGKDTTMNATMNNLTATATTSKKFAFTYDHVNQKIVGKDVDFQKAGIPGSALEKELNARMEARPSYGFTIIPTEKKPAKRTYKGLNRALVEAYINIQEAALKDTLNACLKQMDKDGYTFPTIRGWFLEEFKDFSVNKALREIQQFKANATKEKVRGIKVSVSTKGLAKQIIDMPKAPATQPADLLNVG